MSLRRYDLHRTGLALLLVTILAACDGFVEDVDPPVDLAQDEDLNDPAEVPFLTAGVLQRFATAHDQIALLASLLSDEFVFGGSQATFSSFQEVDAGDIRLDNNSVDAAYRRVNELRFFADDLVDRVENRVEFEGDDEEAIRREALFVGTLYGGIGRYLLATYFGLDPDRGGGVISTAEEYGPFIPSVDLYDRAVDHFRAALDLTDDPYERRVVHSLVAKSLLYKATAADGPGLTALAAEIRSAAESGLQPGDPAFSSRHSALSPNLYYQQAGIGRTQALPDLRYAEKVGAVVLSRTDFPPTRLSAGDVAGIRIALQPDEGDGAPLRQVNYPDPDAPLPFITWQEVHLVLAELDIHADDQAAARARIDAVRASHRGLDGAPLPPLEGELDTRALLVERAGELFAQGDRLVDQRRYPDLVGFPAASFWQYLPIPQSERNANPNID